MGNKRCSGIIKMLFLCLFSLLQRSNLVKFAQLNLQRLDLGYFQQETAPQRIFRNAAVGGGSLLCSQQKAPGNQSLATEQLPSSALCLVQVFYIR